MEKVNTIHPHDVAGILGTYGQQFLDNHPLSSAQYKAFDAITSCRTAKLGGHLQRCDQCAYERIAYNSCRNRHCNKCQYVKQLKWVDKLKSSLPVCKYFHIVFTIPRLLHKTFYLNQAVCYDLLLKASAQALQKAGGHADFLGAQTGALSVLHTWGQALTYHPHIHMIVPAGGLSEDGCEWIAARGKKFFLPVKVLSRIFRGVLCSMLEKQLADHNIRLPDDVPDFKTLKDQLYEKNWHVYSKKAMGGRHRVVEYLGRYTHRVAISNNRIKKVEDGKVTIGWKDYRKNMAPQGLLTLGAEDFIGRFMRHVLPSGFYKIRYYGFLAAANGVKKQRCIALMVSQPPISLLEGLPNNVVIKMVTGKDPGRCPKCNKGVMRDVGQIAEIREKPS